LKLFLDLAKTFFSRLAILVLAAFVFLAVDAYQSKRDSLENALQQLDENIEKLKKAKAKLQRQIKDARESIDSIDSKIEWWEKPHPPRYATASQLAAYMAVWTVQHVKMIKELEDQRQALEKQINELTDKVQSTGDRINRFVDEKIQALAVAQNRGPLSDIFNREFLLASVVSHKYVLMVIFFALFFGRISLKATNFYLLAPLAKKATPITINHNDPAHANEINYGTPQKEIKLAVDKAHSLVVKPGWYSLNTEGNTKTRFFWDWANPFASYAMGLVKMTEFEPDKYQLREVTVASEDDPNHDIIPLYLEDHTGYVVKHGHVVATSGNELVMRKRWRFWDWKSWLFGNIRYVFFTGTGFVYVHGYGSVSTNDNANTNNRIKERHVIGFDTRTSFRMIRTETFVNYWLNNKPLYDINFLGHGSFLQQQSFGRKDEKIFRSLLEDILGAVGKVLGF
jgi:cell division septum initiation protein DivIVA